MTTDQKLQAIKDKCHELLALAENENNGRFIAACAGAAEAGWRATIAAIEGLRWLSGKDDDVIGNNTVNAILAAWEGQGLWT